MHYFFPQNMVDTVRAWPEYNKVLEIVREKDLHVDSLIEILRILYGPFLRGNVFNDWTCNGISVCFVLTYIKISSYRIPCRSNDSNDKHSYFIIPKETTKVSLAVQCP